MGRHYVSTAAACPFYRYEDPRSVYCEGVQDGSTIRFYHDEDVQSLRVFKAKYCQRDWQGCPIASMLWKEKEK